MTTLSNFIKESNLWTQQERLNSLIESSLEEWNFRSQYRYCVFKERVSGPFSLKFLTSEIIKRQQYIVANVHRLQIIKGEKSNWRRISSNLWLKLREIESKDFSQIMEETLVLTRNRDGQNKNSF